MNGNLIAPNVQNTITIVIMGTIGFALAMLIHKFASGKLAQSNNSGG